MNYLVLIVGLELFLLVVLYFLPEEAWHKLLDKEII